MPARDLGIFGVFGGQGGLDFSGGGAIIVISVFKISKTPGTDNILRKRRTQDG